LWYVGANLELKVQNTGAILVRCRVILVASRAILVGFMVIFVASRGNFLWHGGGNSCDI